jgi:hypothetical protein
VTLFARWGFAEDHQFNVRWLKAACRILKPNGTIWVTGTHHIIFSLGFALQTMKFKLINVTSAKPDPPPNALHTAFTHLKAVEAIPPPPPFCAPQVELLDHSSPFASKANVVAYDRHVLFTSDDPTGATRHCAPSPISTTRIEEAFVHEMPEQLVGLVFAQADLVAYACDLGVGVHLIPSALTLVDSPEHGFALVVGKLCRHYAPLPIVPLLTVRLPDRTAISPTGASLSIMRVQ